jgi:hypothetical protein
MKQLLELLKEYADYSDDNVHKSFQIEYYLHERDNDISIIKKYKLDELLDGKKDLELILQLLNLVY